MKSHQIDLKGNKRITVPISEEIDAIRKQIEIDTGVLMTYRQLINHMINFYLARRTQPTSAAIQTVWRHPKWWTPLSSKHGVWRTYLSFPTRHTPNWWSKRKLFSSFSAIWRLPLRRTEGWTKMTNDSWLRFDYVGRSNSIVYQLDCSQTQGKNTWINQCGTTKQSKRMNQVKA